MARLFNGNAANYLSSTLQYDLPANWTILFRVKNVVNNASHQIIMGRRGGDGNGWAIGRFDSGAFAFWAFGATGAVSLGSIAAGSGAFDAYALTRESTAAVGTFYQNSTTPLGTAAITTVATTGAGLSVGAFNDAGASSFPTNGELAEIAIFSRVLSSAELAQWFAGDSPSLYNTGLVHYWKLDAASGNESATVGGATLTQVGTVTATTHPAMNYGGPAPHLISIANSQQVNQASPGSISSSAVSGTITLPACRQWETGNLRTGESGVVVIVNNPTTGALVIKKTGLTTHATTGECVVTDPAIVTGTNYRATQILPDGSEGTWRYTAT